VKVGSRFCGGDAHTWIRAEFVVSVNQSRQKKTTGSESVQILCPVQLVVSRKSAAHTSLLPIFSRPLKVSVRLVLMVNGSSGGATARLGWGGELRGRHSYV
jgi:hypothetical protein